MSTIGSRRYNDCPRCPIVGQGNTSENDFFQILGLRFNLHDARQLCLNQVAIPVESVGLERWLQEMPIEWKHVDHLPPALGPGIMVTLPSGCGMPLIDGNHRAARALRDRKEFFAFVLSETETLELLRRSLGAHLADDYWRRMRNSKPHPKDVPQGEQQ